MNTNNNRKYLYEKLYEALSKEIAEGLFGDNGLLPSEREIGERFSADRTTVRKALSLLVEDGLVEKKAGVGTKVIQNTPSTSRPTPPQSKTIAFFLPRSQNKQDRITQPFYSALFYNIEKECRKLDYHLSYSTLDENDNFNDILLSGNYAGVIFISNVSRRHLDLALELKYPSILINGTYPKMTSIVQDNFLGAYNACKYLIDLGHKNIAIVKGIADYVSTQERWRAVQAAFSDAERPLLKEYVVQTDWEFESGWQACKDLLLNASVPPTAIFAFNDTLALACVQACQSLGYAIPDDISVIGFDNAEQSKYSVPQLTTVNSNVSIIAKASIQNLLNQINGEVSYIAKTITPVDLIIRGSVSPPRKY